MLDRSKRHTLAAVIAASLLGGAGCGGLGPGDYITYRVAFEDTKLGASCFPNDEIPESIKDDTTTFRNGATFIIYLTADEEALLDNGEDVLSGTIADDVYSFTGKTADVEYAPGDIIFDADHDGIEDNVDTMVDADMDGLDDDPGLGLDQMVDTDMDGDDDRFGDPLVDANLDGEDDRLVEQPSEAKTTITRSVAVEMTVDGSTVTGTTTTKLAQKCTGADCDPDYDASCTISSSFEGVEIEETDPAFGGSSPPNPTP